MNSSSGYTNGFEEINVSFKPSGVYKNDNGNDGSAVLLDENKNLYLTNKSVITFRENILQQNWCLVASNVKKFNASTNSNCIAYIDNNDDLWVARR